MVKTESPQKPRMRPKQYLTDTPLKCVELDILGPLSITYTQKRYIVLFIDYFTKCTEAYPIKNRETHTGVDKLVLGLIAIGLIMSYPC